MSQFQENCVTDARTHWCTEARMWIHTTHPVKNRGSNIDCLECSLLLTSPLNDHQYCYLPYDSLVNRKDRGGLTHSSYGTYKVVLTCEKLFKVKVLNTSIKISTDNCLVKRMVHEVVCSCEWISCTSHQYQIMDSK